MSSRSRRSRITLVIGVLAVWMTGGWARAVDPPPDQVTERFSGQGGRGPYLLAWRNFASGSERITLNGGRLFRQQDYLIDYAAGTLALNVPVRPNDEVVVEYRPGNGQPNAANGAASSIQLLDGGPIRLQATYLLAPRATGATDGSLRVSAVGLGAQTGGGHWNLKSNLLLGTGGGRLDDRSGLGVGGDVGYGALKLTGDYARTGGALTTGVDGAPPATQTTGLGLVYGASDRFRLSSQYRETEGTGANASRMTTVQHELDLKPSRDASIVAKRVTEETGTAGKTSTTRSDTLRYEQKLAGGASAVARIQSVASGNADTETASIGVSTKVVPGVAVETTAYHKRTDTDGKDAKTENGVQAKVTTSAGPFDVRTQLDAKSADDARQSTAGIDVASRGGVVKVHGEMGRNTGSGADQGRSQASVDLTPSKPIHLTVGISRSEDAGQGTGAAPTRLSDQQYGVEYHPTDALSVSARFQDKTDAGKETGVRATPLRSARFTPCSSPARFTSEPRRPARRIPTA